MKDERKNTEERIIQQSQADLSLRATMPTAFWPRHA